MRKKISIGFISLAFILLFAGGISMYELNRLQRQTREVLETSDRNVRLADKMFAALRKQNSSILRMTVSGGTTPDDNYTAGKNDFDKALADASASTTERKDLTEIYEANTHYRFIISGYTQAVENGEATEWFSSAYLSAYYQLDEAIMNYVTSPATSNTARISMLEDSVYKTITPSILTLIIAIIIVLMFYFFVDSFYVRPITRIYQSLRNYVKHRIPFAPKFESNDDEIIGIKETIEELIEQRKSK